MPTVGQIESNSMFRINMSLGLRILLTLLISPVIGYFAGSAYSFWALSDERIPWEPLGSPPAPAVKFFNSSNRVIVIDSNEKGYFIGACNPDCWIPFENNLENEPREAFYEFCGDVQPPYINKVVDTAETCYPWGLGYSYAKYVILEDGTVWKWMKSDGGESNPFLYPILGTVSFIVLGVLIIIIMLLFHLVSRLDERAKTNGIGSANLRA